MWANQRPVLTQIRFTRLGHLTGNSLQFGESAQFRGGEESGRTNDVPSLLEIMNGFFRGKDVVLIVRVL